MKEHHGLWLVPVSSHKLQGVREMGTETTESVHTACLLCCERTNFLHPVHLHTVPPWAISGAPPRQSSLKKCDCQCYLGRTGTNFLIFLHRPSKLGWRKKNKRKRERLWLTTGSRKCSHCIQCYTVNMSTYVSVYTSGGIHTQLWAYSITVWQRVLNTLNHTGKENKFVISNSWIHK